MKPIAIDGFCKLKFLSRVTFSPKGTSACLVVTEIDREKDEYRSCLWLRRGGKLKKLTSFGKESSFQYLDEDTILVTHDAVRPFVTVGMIEAGIAMAKTGTPAMTVIPATDTIVCSVDGKRIDQVPDRTTMYQMQTPQTFGAVLFCRCFEQLTVEEQNNVTDASGVFLRTGVPVGMVAGAKTNIKITWPEDLIIAEQFCR